MPAARKAWIALVLFGIGAFGVAIWDVTMGGFYFTVAGVRISSWEAYKPFRLGVFATALALWLRDRTAPPHAISWHWVQSSSSRIAAACALVSIAAAVRYGIFAAGGADAYGYVSQASLWAGGRLIMPDPLAALEPSLGQAVAPLGYKLARHLGLLSRSILRGFQLRWHSRSRSQDLAPCTTWSRSWAG